MTRKAHCLVALALLVPAPVIGAVVGFIVAPGAAGKTVYALAKLWMLLVPLLWLRWVERRPLRLPPPARAGLLAGCLLGVAIGGVIAGAYIWLGEAWIDPDQFRTFAVEKGFGTLGEYLVLGAYIAFLNSLLEEYVWRWFVFRRAEELLGGPAAVLVSAFFFTIHHAILLGVEFNAKVAALSSAGIFIGGALWSGLYLRYRSVWPGYLCHVVVDLAVLAIGYHILFT